MHRMRDNMKNYKQVSYIILILLAGYCNISHAICQRVAPIKNSVVSPRLSSINITNTFLQPVGAPLGTSIFNVGTGDLNQVLFQCDVSDIGKIYEQIATSGDDRVGGFYDLGQRDGNPNYFATYFPYVGLRLTHVNSGAVFTRSWKSIPLKNYEIVGDKINIRAKDFSPIKADLVKLSSLPPESGAASNLCGNLASTNMTAIYNCMQPNGYVTFVGPGIPGEQDGSDSAYNRGSQNSGGWNAISMGAAPMASVTYTSTCVARNVTPVVLFPTITEASLNEGNVVRNDFTVTVECDNNAIANASSGSTLLGLQASYSAYAAAEKLGLVNGEGGVKYLLSDDYDSSSNTAKGVGIALSNAATGLSMNFVGWSSCTVSGCPATPASGWYPVASGAQVSSNTANGYTTYTTQFTATLMKIPGQKVTPGKVKATAYVLVRVQ